VIRIRVMEKGVIMGVVMELVRAMMVEMPVF
jgi:hypothetical protein